MEKKRFRVGSIALLFAVVMLCVAIFGTLTVLTAASDLRTARRYGSYVADMTACRNLGEQWLAEAEDFLAGRGELPEDTRWDGSELSAVIEKDNLTLEIRIAVSGSGYEILQWSTRTGWTPDTGWELLQ